MSALTFLQAGRKETNHVLQLTFGDLTSHHLALAQRTARGTCAAGCTQRSMAARHCGPVCTRTACQTVGQAQTLQCWHQDRCLQWAALFFLSSRAFHSNQLGADKTHINKKQTSKGCQKARKWYFSNAPVLMAFTFFSTLVAPLAENTINSLS